MVSELMGFKVSVTEIELYALNFTISHRKWMSRVMLFPVELFSHEVMRATSLYNVIVMEKCNGDGCININYAP